jgi:hypothetical protein
VQLEPLVPQVRLVLRVSKVLLVLVLPFLVHTQLSKSLKLHSQQEVKEMAIL